MIMELLFLRGLFEILCELCLFLTRKKIISTRFKKKKKKKLEKKMSQVMSSGGGIFLIRYASTYIRSIFFFSHKHCQQKECLALEVAPAEAASA